MTNRTAIASFAVTIYFAFFTLSGYSQVDDGIYVLPEQNTYVLAISNENLVKAYLFNFEGFWEPLEGYRVDDTVELSQIKQDSISAWRLSDNSLGVAAEVLYRNQYPIDLAADTDVATTLQALPVLLANGELKAVYRTQYGADLVFFQSDDFAVFLSFEFGDSTSERTWVGAYTASLGEDLVFTNIEPVVETPDDDNEVQLSFEARLSDRDKLQAEFTNVQCQVLESDSSDEFCEAIRQVFFSKLVRIF